MDASQLETLLRAYCRSSEAVVTRPKLDFTSGERASLLDSGNRRSKEFVERLRAACTVPPLSWVGRNCLALNFETQVSSWVSCGLFMFKPLNCPPPFLLRTGFEFHRVRLARRRWGYWRRKNSSKRASIILCVGFSGTHTFRAGCRRKC